MLDMGRPVKIVDVARTIIQLSGRKEEEIEIKFVGLRPGEKLHEEVFASDELTDRTPHPKVRVAKARGMPAEWIDELLPELRRSTLADDETRDFLRGQVPEYVEAQNEVASATDPVAPAQAGAQVASG